MNELDLTPGAIEVAPDSVLTRDAERWSGGDHVERELSYWREQLRGIPAILELPTDRPRPPKQSFRAGRESVVLPRGLKRALEELSERERVLVFVVLVAAYQTLLSRYTRQDDIVVGCALPACEETSRQELIEGFASVAVIRTDMSGDPTFRRLLSRVRDAANSAREHQNVPWDRLVEAVQPDRDASRHPVFQTMFSVEDSQSPTELDWETAEPAAETGALQVDLQLQLRDEPEGFAAHFTYSTDLFDAATIVRMAGHFRKLLESIVANPDEQISQLPLLTDAERHQLVVEWNAARIPFPPAEGIHQLFEQQVERTPNALAVTCNGQSLSYRELNARANRLAHYLRKNGVGPEVLVGICAERSLKLVVGILGILKAGGAYVPLDPAYPKDRLAVILEDAKAPIVLTEESLTGTLPHETARLIRLDSDWPAIALEPATNPLRNITLSNLAYVLFTSGSTGRPKGVALEHRSAVIFVQWAREVFLPEEVAGTLFSTSICFDLSVFEMFVPLSMGGTVIVAQNALALPDLQAPGDVTLINTVPSAIAELLRSGTIPPSVRVVNLAGEALPGSLAQQIYQGTAVRKLYNLYGPTEDTTYSTYTLVPRGGEVTIGRPLHNTQVYILDQNRQPVPIGVPGELYLAGDGLARGYFGREDLTAERFVPNPFSSQTGSRMYRTGDLTRFLADGNIQYLGRIDNQVKIRGFRIELGEIDAVLRQHPGINETVVVAREDRPGDKRVVAYLVVRQNATPTTAELRAFLKEKLPEYMLPSAFVILKSMPLTPNGKVNRRALPAPDHADLAPQAEFAAPKDAVESRLVQFWEAVLEVAPIGVRDNYFDLGGHSLTAVKLMHRIEEAFGKNLPLSTLLQAPTVEQLAAILRQNGSLPPWSCLVPIQTAGSKPPFFCVHGANGAVIRFHALARHLGPDRPFYGLQANGLGAGQACHERTEEMAEHYIEEIRSVRPHGPYYLGGYSFGGAIAFEMAQQLAVLGEEVSVVLFDTYLPVPKTSVSTSAVSVLLSFFRAPAPEKPAYLWRILSKPIRDVQRRLHVARLPHNSKKVRKACLQAEQEYRPRPYPGRVTLFRSSHKALGQVVDPRAEWQRYAARGLEICEIPGNHENILLEPQVRFVADHLGAFLDGSPAPLADTPQLTRTDK